MLSPSALNQPPSAAAAPGPFADFWGAWSGLIAGLAADGKLELPSPAELVGGAATVRGGPFSQHVLCAAFEARLLERWRATAGEAARARLASCGGPHSGDWLQVLPSCGLFSLRDDEVQHLVSVRLGLRLPLAPLWRARCAAPACRHPDQLDNLGVHFSSCTAARSAVSCRHHSVCTTWRALCKSGR